MVAFCGRILTLGKWNLEMSWCKCPGVPRGQPPGMAADKCIKDMSHRNRRFHGRRRHLGCGANTAKFTVNVWEKSSF